VLQTVKAWKINQKFVILKRKMKMALILYKRRRQKPELSFYKLILIFLVPCALALGSFIMHPYYVSVTEIEYKPTEKEVQIAGKLFIDDLEYALAQEFKTKVEILNTTAKQKNEKLLAAFFQKHLKISIDGKPVSFALLGFDREEEAIWTYLEIKNVNQLKSATVFNDLLYGFRQDQINIIHLLIRATAKVIV